MMMLNKFRLFDMILKDKILFLTISEEISDIPGPQHIPFAAHRPLGTTEQAALWIEHGIPLRFSVEH